MTIYGNLRTAYLDTDHLKYRAARIWPFIGEDIHRLILRRPAYAKLYCTLETRESSMISYLVDFTRTPCFISFVASPSDVDFDMRLVRRFSSKVSASCLAPAM